MLSPSFEKGEHFPCNELKIPSRQLLVDIFHIYRIAWFLFNLMGGRRSGPHQPAAFVEEQGTRCAEPGFRFYAFREEPVKLPGEELKIRPLKFFINLAPRNFSLLILKLPRLLGCDELSIPTEENI